MKKKWYINKEKQSQVKNSPKHPEVSKGVKGSECCWKYTESGKTE